MTDVVIASAARTAIGSYGKSLAGVPPTELGATASTAALERAGVSPDQVDHVVFGNVIHTEPGQYWMPSALQRSSTSWSGAISSLGS